MRYKTLQTTHNAIQTSLDIDKDILQHYFSSRLMILSLALSIYIQLSGSNGVGGGFQAGCLFASVIIFLTRNVVLDGAHTCLQYAAKLKSVLFPSLTCATLIYVLCCILPGFSSNLMDYTYLPLIKSSSGGILTAEISVGIIVAAALRIIL